MVIVCMINSSMITHFSVPLKKVRFGVNLLSAILRETEMDRERSRHRNACLCSCNVCKSEIRWELVQRENCFC